jgi:hypothetical protein
MKRILIALLVAVTLLLWMLPAGAASPDALLSDADRRHQEQALQNALEFNRTGEAEYWENAVTGHRGQVTPTLTYRNAGGQDCRKFERELEIDGRWAEARGTRCRTVAGVWRQPPPPRPVYTRGHDYPWHRHGPPYGSFLYPPASLHLFYGFGIHGHGTGYHRHRRHRHHYRSHRHHRHHRHGRAHRHDGGHRHDRGHRHRRR